MFPTSIRPYLRIVAELGLVLFMFLVGLEVDPEVIRRSGRKAAVISVSSIVLPFALGVAVLAPILYGAHRMVGGKPVSAAPFALFLGVSMCATAFAVLARVLAERRMFQIPLGSLLLSAAAVDDVLAYSLLAVTLAVAASSGLLAVPLHLLGLVVVVAVLFLAVRPVLGRFLLASFERKGGLAPDALAIVVAGLFVTVFVTQHLGLATLVGAFLFGLAMPRRGTRPLIHGLVERLEPLSTTVLLPVFFVVTGLSVDLGGVGWSGLPVIAFVILVASAGKFIGASGSAWLLRVPKRQALAIGVMMNTRGLAELVILNKGHEAGVLDGRIYTVLVVMAIVTTLMAGPLLRRVYPQRWIDQEIAAAERARDGTESEVVAVVDDLDDLERLEAVAVDAARSLPSSRLHLVHLTERAAAHDAGLRAMTSSMTLLEHARRGLADRGVSARVTSRACDDKQAALAGLMASAPALVIAAWPDNEARSPAAAASARWLLSSSTCDAAILVGSAAGTRVVSAGELARGGARMGGTPRPLQGGAGHSQRDGPTQPVAGRHHRRRRRGDRRARRPPGWAGRGGQRADRVGGSSARPVGRTSGGVWRPAAARPWPPTGNAPAWPRRSVWNRSLPGRRRPAPRRSQAHSSSSAPVSRRSRTRAVRRPFRRRRLPPAP